MCRSAHKGPLSESGSFSEPQLPSWEGPRGTKHSAHWHSDGYFYYYRYWFVIITKQQSFHWALSQQYSEASWMVHRWPLGTKTAAFQFTATKELHHRFIQTRTNAHKAMRPTGGASCHWSGQAARWAFDYMYGAPTMRQPLYETPRKQVKGQKYSWPNIGSSTKVRQKNKQVITWNSDTQYAEINTGQCTRGKPGARKAGCRLASSSVSGAVPAWGTPASLTCTVEGGGGGSLHHPRGLLQVRFSTTQFWENTYSAKGQGTEQERCPVSPLKNPELWGGGETVVGRAPSAQEGTGKHWLSHPFSWKASPSCLQLLGQCWQKGLWAPQSWVKVGPLLPRPQRHLRSQTVSLSEACSAPAVAAPEMPWPVLATGHWRHLKIHCGWLGSAFYHRFSCCSTGWTLSSCVARTGSKGQGGREREKVREASSQPKGPGQAHLYRTQWSLGGWEWVAHLATPIPAERSGNQGQYFQSKWTFI